MTDSLSSVDNALRLVQMLGERSEVGVAEAGRSLGVARSTAHRLLTSLVVHGFASQDPERRTYRAGPMLAQAGLAVIERYDVRERGKPYLEAVSARTGETTHLVVLAGTAALFIDGVEGRNPVRTSPRLGTSMPAHIASGGKALLADLTPKALRSLYPDDEVSIAMSHPALTRELEQIRAQGYALNIGGWDKQINAVSVPVRDQNGVARFAIGVSSPAFRAGEDVLRELADTLLELCCRPTV
jgi:IclR family transcriptional regulator, acetate operon repressor